jgi:hypothetical protein
LQCVAVASVSRKADVGARTAMLDRDEIKNAEAGGLAGLPYPAILFR